MRPFGGRIGRPRVVWGWAVSTVGCPRFLGQDDCWVTGVNGFCGIGSCTALTFVVTNGKVCFVVFFVRLAKEEDAYS